MALDKIKQIQEFLWFTPQSELSVLVHVDLDVQFSCTAERSVLLSSLLMDPGHSHSPAGQAGRGAGTASTSMKLLTELKTPSVPVQHCVLCQESKKGSRPLSDPKQDIPALKGIAGSYKPIAKLPTAQFKQKSEISGPFQKALEVAAKHQMIPYDFRECPWI